MHQKVSDVCKHPQGKGKQDHLSVVFLEIPKDVSKTAFCLLQIVKHRTFNLLFATASF